MGVWIEMVRYLYFLPLFTVTPYVGVWIEMDQQKEAELGKASPPMWGCGLKFTVTEDMRQ